MWELQSAMMSRKLIQSQDKRVREKTCSGSKNVATQKRNLLSWGRTHSPRDRTGLLSCGDNGADTDVLQVEEDREKGWELWSLQTSPTTACTSELSTISLGCALCDCHQRWSGDLPLSQACPEVVGHLTMCLLTTFTS